MDYSFSETLPAAFPADCRADEYLVLTEGGTPVHCCALFSSAPGEPAEIGMYTLPGYRRQGYAKKALHILRSSGRGAAFSLYLPEKEAESSLPALLSLGALRLPEEYLLELGPEYPKAGSNTPAGKLFFRITGKKNNGLLFTFFLKNQAGNRERQIPAARFRLTMSGKEALLHGFSWMDKQGITKLSLHVGGDNLPALSLYKKTGFRTAETLYHVLFP